MAGVSPQLQKSLGRFLKVWLRVKNRFQVNYTLVKDLTNVSGSTEALTIFLGKTPSVEITELFAGRAVTFKPSGGALAQEALPLFLVSRESLKVGSTFHVPTKFDSFVEVGTTAPIYFVREIETIGEDAAGYRLTVTTEFNQYAGD